LVVHGIVRYTPYPGHTSVLRPDTALTGVRGVEPLLQSCIHRDSRVNLLVVQWKEDPSMYKPDELRGALDSFREPLYRHLAEEVFVG